MKKVLTRPSVEDLPTGLSKKIPVGMNPDRDKDRKIRQLQRQIRNLKKDTHVSGYWVFGVSKKGDLIKWGKDGDVVEPFHTKLQAYFQAKSITDKSIVRYIITVRINGQILTEEVE